MILFEGWKKINEMFKAMFKSIFKFRICSYFMYLKVLIGNNFRLYFWKFSQIKNRTLVRMAQRPEIRLVYLWLDWVLWWWHSSLKQYDQYIYNNIPNLPEFPCWPCLWGRRFWICARGWCPLPGRGSAGTGWGRRTSCTRRWRPGVRPGTHPHHPHDVRVLQLGHQPHLLLEVSPASTKHTWPSTIKNCLSKFSKTVIVQTWNLLEEEM